VELSFVPGSNTEPCPATAESRTGVCARMFNLKNAADDATPLVTGRCVRSIPHDVSSSRIALRIASKFAKQRERVPEHI
jgi:hypothetical protein